MGRYLSHDLGAAAPKDLDPYIAEDSILTCLLDKDTVAEKQAIVDDNIGDSEDTVDGFLRRAGYVTPVVTPTRDILAAVGAVVAFALWSRGSGPPEVAVERYKSKMAWLNLVGRQETQLDIPRIPLDSTSGGGALYTSRETRRVDPRTCDW